MPSSKKDPAYIAFIDEFGDPGLKPSASDWFIPSAALVRAGNEHLIQGWIASIKEPMKNQKRADLHFKKLSPGMRQRACKMLGQLPVRVFTNMSRKSNMHYYRRPDLCDGPYKGGCKKRHRTARRFWRYRLAETADEGQQAAYYRSGRDFPLLRLA